MYTSQVNELLLDQHFCLTMLYEHVHYHFLGGRANLVEPMFSLYIAIDSRGCVITLFLPLSHELTLLSHDVVQKPIKLSGTTLMRKSDSCPAYVFPLVCYRFMWLCDHSLLTFEACAYTFVSWCCTETYQTFRDHFDEEERLLSSLCFSFSLL